MTDEQIARFIASKQKKLLFWREYFSKLDSVSEEAKELPGMLSTYATLLSKLVKDKSQETLEHIFKVERQINEMFDSARLETSPLN